MGFLLEEIKSKIEQSQMVVFSLLINSNLAFRPATEALFRIRIPRGLVELDKLELDSRVSHRLGKLSLDLDFSQIKALAFLVITRILITKLDSGILWLLRAISNPKLRGDLIKLILFLPTQETINSKCNRDSAAVTNRLFSRLFNQ